MEKITFVIIIIVILLLIIGVGYGVYREAKDSDKSKEALNNAQNNVENQNQPMSKPTTVIQTGKTYTAILKTTAGDITLELDADKTPIAVNSFVYLAKNNFYNNTIFHRVIEGFMIQGGDPKGDGTGGPGYRFKDELFEDEYTRGTLAMANAGPDTNGSQFFIMHQDNTQLPKNYVIFGRVIQGIEVVDKIAIAPVEANLSGEMSKPKNPVAVKSIEIIEE